MRVTVRYTGTIPLCNELHQELEEAGYEITTPGIGGPDPAQIVNTFLTVTGHPAVWGPLVLIVRKFRKRHPETKVDIEGVDEDEQAPPEGE